MGNHDVEGCPFRNPYSDLICRSTAETALDRRCPRVGPKELRFVIKA